MIIKNYEEQVYAGVLGKVIGVYMGRPFEGWHKERLVERWGLVDRYVHEEQNVPLVVADDDISGTLTFVRVLADTGLYDKTPVERFGDNWLNYIVPFRSILWWGGMGMSTEHTAFIRLMNGVKAPKSGSIELNGRTVAEQIGAQIFIDAFGLVAPGKPELAAELARKAGSVSHDGEAVHGAVVVAAMVSAAFVEKDMDRLLDTGVAQVPKDSLIAQVHRDVRKWCREDRDWQKTYERIKETYGYATYGGGCHMIPNHAIMVMAWAYAPDDFQMSQAIINTAGWDTDCNAANVGSVMGVKVGLAGINKQYDFQGPMADRVLLPTAEGTHGVTDCLTQALEIAAAGRRVMGWDPLPAPKDGAQHHFSMPGSLHGWMSEDDSFVTRGVADVRNHGPEDYSARVMSIAAADLCRGRVARVSTPVCPRPRSGGYGLTGCPKLYSGMAVEATGKAPSAGAGTTARLFVRYLEQSTKKVTGVAYGEAVRLGSHKPFTLSLKVPDTKGWPVTDLGIELAGEDHAGARIEMDRVRWNGTPSFTLTGPELPQVGEKQVVGWIPDVDLRWNNMSYRIPDLICFGKDNGRGHLATGTREWTDYAFEAEMAVHCADAAGLMVRFQGLLRYVALLKTAAGIKLVRRCYEETVLAEKPLAWDVDTLHTLKLVAKGERITAFVDGAKVFEHTEKELSCGGAGFVVETGVVGVKRATVGAAV